MNKDLKEKIEKLLELSKKPLLIQGTTDVVTDELSKDKDNSVIFDCEDAVQYDYKYNNIEGYNSNPEWYNNLVNKCNNNNDKVIMVFKDIQKLPYSLLYRLIVCLCSDNFGGNYELPTNSRIVCTNNELVDSTSLLPKTISKYFNVVNVNNNRNIKRK